MKASSITTIFAEMQRFAATLDAAKERLETDPDMFPYPGTKESAAARRASMDLTRALVRFRRGE